MQKTLRSSLLAPLALTLSFFSACKEGSPDLSGSVPPQYATLAATRFDDSKPWNLERRGLASDGGYSRIESISPSDGVLALEASSSISDDNRGGGRLVFEDVEVFSTFDLQAAFTQQKPLYLKLLVEEFDTDQLELEFSIEGKKFIWTAPVSAIGAKEIVFGFTSYVEGEHALETVIDGGASSFESKYRLGRSTQKLEGQIRVGLRIKAERDSSSVKSVALNGLFFYQ